MDGFWCSRCLNDHSNPPDIIGSFASGTTATFQTSWFLILISGYLEAEIDYRVVSQDYTQKNSSQFDQNWRWSGDFCNFCHGINTSVGKIF